MSTLKMVEIFVQVLNPQNATCGEGEGGVCVSQLVASIPDKHNVLDRRPDDYIVLDSEIIPTRCNNCVYSSQWLYSTCFG